VLLAADTRTRFYDYWKSRVQNAPCKECMM